MATSVIDQRINEAHRNLMDMGFEPSSRGKRRRPGESDSDYQLRRNLYENWYTCIVVAMLVQPVDIVESHALAIHAAGVLGLPLNDGDSANDKPQPRWHMGFKGTNRYFRTGGGARPRNVGVNHNFDNLNLFCQTHRLSWNRTDSLANTERCTEFCKYGLRQP
jgi:hypothetical protein